MMFRMLLNPKSQAYKNKVWDLGVLLNPQAQALRFL